jgi:hypothetical protein
MSEIGMMLAWPGEAKTERDDPPEDFGPGYLAYRIRTDFRDLSRLIGKESARQEVAEIVNAEFTRRTVEHETR